MQYFVESEPGCGTTMRIAAVVNLNANIDIKMVNRRFKAKDMKKTAKINNNVCWAVTVYSNSRHHGVRYSA